MKKLSKYLLTRWANLSLLACPLLLMPANEQPLDNLTILNNMVATVTNKAVDLLSPDSSASFLIRPQSQQQRGNWLIENWLIKSLYQKGIAKIYVEHQPSDSHNVIEYQIYDLGVNYFPTDNNSIIERRFRLNLLIRAWETSTGKVSLYREFTEQYVDSVAVLMVKKLEHDYSFCRDDLPAERGLKRFIEPFIVMTATAGIIYLFFRLRSN